MGVPGIRCGRAGLRTMRARVLSRKAGGLAGLEVNKDTRTQSRARSPIARAERESRARAASLALTSEQASEFKCRPGSRSSTKRPLPGTIRLGQSVQEDIGAVMGSDIGC